jgi:hypothetical protein
MIAPLLLWILINFGIAIYLPGAGFFVIPVYFGLLMLAYFIVTQQTNLFVNLILSIPACIIFVPFIIQFPIGLGLKMLAGSAVLTVLVFALLLPVFGSFAQKRIWVSAFLVLSLVFFGIAHFNSDYEAGKAKPNSLVYFLDADKSQAIWATYDYNLDRWTKSYLGENPQKADTIGKNNLFSKYNSAFTFTTKAPLKNLAVPTILFLRDSVAGNQRYLKIRITPNRKVNRYDIFADKKMRIYNLKANHTTLIGQKGSLYQRKNKRVLSYYVIGNEPLDLEFSIAAKSVLDMDLLESSFDLMNNPLFSMIQRTSEMMPTPFLLTDAIIIQKKIEPSEKTVLTEAHIIVPTFEARNDSIVQTVDTIKIK